MSAAFHHCLRRRPHFDIREREPRPDRTLATNLAIPGLGALSGVLLARVLGPSDRGDLAVVMTVPMILAAVASVGMSEALAYFVARTTDRDRRARLLRSAMLIGASGSLLGLGGVALISQAVLHGRESDVTRAGLVVAVYVPAMVVVLVAQGWYRGSSDLRHWNAMRVLPTACWVGGVIAVSLTDPTVLGMGFTFAVSGLAAAVVAAILLRSGDVHVRADGCPEDAPTARPLLAYGLPSAASAVPRVMNVRLDQLILIGFVGSRDLGLYVTAVAWTAAIAAIGSAAAMRDFTRVATLDGTARRDVIIEIYRRAIATSVAAGLVLGLITTAAFTRVFGNEYRDAVGLAIAMLPAGVLLSLMTVSTTVLWACGLPVQLLFADSMALIVTLALLVALVPTFGLAGAVIASTVAYLTSVSFAAWVLLRPPADRVDESDTQLRAPSRQR